MESIKSVYNVRALDTMILISGQLINIVVVDTIVHIILLFVSCRVSGLILEMTMYVSQLMSVSSDDM